ncbi:glucosaminidase domain-containing protein [Bacillus sp. WC2502]|uniref:glucosaminidase domain-containing protein n=1 Tax=Bacillus sp. WC2502 TaxID=3461401 RepID=UPI004043FE0B
MATLQDNFIKSIAGAAQEVGNKGGILPSLIIAQAIHESNWGRSGLAVKSKNLFGVKGKGSAGTHYYPTKEYSKSRGWYTENAGFRAYKGFYDSIYDLVFVLYRYTRYKNVIGEKDFRKACREVQRAGYATDPDYAEKLIQTILARNLTQYDKGVVKTGKVSKPVKAPAKVKATYYTVKAGDILGRIAINNKTSVSKLVKLNPSIKNANLIYAGQKIRVK